MDDKDFLKFADLNSFVVHITKFYSHVFEMLKRRYPRCKLQSWVEAFVLSSELEKKGDTSLHDAISSIMENEAGLSLDEWKQLQELRRMRNSVAHPSSSVSRAKEALRERWRDHPANSALVKMLNLAERISTPPPRSSPGPVPLTNWRARTRSSSMSKSLFKKK